ncbi:F-box incomplete domain containing protein [Pandoravirus macleodensis]|uniref:F-box incomplete domain containing protein n=1 Tax=Pandoravirus macleodensis TaxID=2107707 RepID=A0A2U7UFC6_9VIRU|nr:F-box incomplete domain containing protein [Pandoravirus macleodensis]AVK77179.1 F-box incomplete domain containing protein [Pandoravirus macleodensis]
MEQAILPAEIMSAIFLSVPDVWWVMAARTCRWWRACIQETVKIRRKPRYHFLRQVSYSLAMDAAVRGGHVGVIDWLVQELGEPLDGAAAAAIWMATRHACSWQQAAVDAVREGADVAVIIWIARKSVGHTLPMAAAIVYGRDDCVKAILCERTVIDVGTSQGSCWAMFPPRHWVSIGTHATACAVVAGKFGRGPHFDDDMWEVGASTLFVAAAVGVPIDHLEAKIADTRSARQSRAQGMLPAARWLEAHRPSFGSANIALRNPAAQNSASTLGQAMPNAMTLPEDTAAPSWPQMRQLLPCDLLPGGVLGTFCDLDTDNNYTASGTVYLLDLLSPLLVDPSDRQALGSCLPSFPGGDRLRGGLYGGKRPRFLWSYDGPFS